MANITYEDFTYACNNNNFEKFNGEIPFEITFKQWADINDNTNFKVILTDSGQFNIFDQNGNQLDIADILKEDNFTECKFYYKEKKINERSFDKICKPILSNLSKNKNFGMAEFYTIIFLWCLKIRGNEIFEELTNNNKFTNGTGNFIEVKGKKIHLGVNAEKLNKRIPYLIKNYLRDYYAYKVIFTPPNIKNNSNSIGNGGNAMSENNKDFNIKDIIKEKIEKHKQIIFTGAPGTGKTYAVKQCVKTLVNDDDSRYKFVQFHASYDYTDFVEGIRPMPKNESGKNIFVRVDGQFKSFCRMIVEANDAKKPNEPKDMYYFIIDEINRADLSKVFGELMYGLEESYRGKDNRFDTQYQNLPTYKYDKKENKAVKIENDVFADGFYVPENLTIIGTMNDIDRSVETFDFALRRRFTWVEIKANDVMLNSVTEININDKGTDDISKIAEKITAIKGKIIAMNNVISGDTGKSLGLNESYHIGPAYFKNLFDEDDNDNLEIIFSERIEPLLREYVRGRSADKINNFITECKGKLLPKVSGDTDAEE